MRHLNRKQKNTIKGITTIGNLMWQDQNLNRKIRGGWHRALRYCKSLTLGGHSDWYLPNKKQLSLLYRNKKELKYIIPKPYWSSTNSPYDNGDAKYINFYNGSEYNLDKVKSLYVRCVRSGE